MIGMSDWMKQLSQKLQQLPLETSIGALWVKVLKFQYVPPGPDWHVAPHKHSSYEFHFIASGKGYVQMGDSQQFTVEKGMLYLTGPEITHSQITDRNDPMAELCVQCQITLRNAGEDVEFQEAQQLLKILNTPVYHGVKDEYGAIPLFIQCAREASEQLVGYFTTIQNNVANLIVCSARALASHQVKALYEVPVKERGYEIVQESVLFLEDNYQRQITLEHVAEFVHFSPRHLGRMFKMVTGKTINQFLTDIRMYRAQTLLKETDYSLEQIANEIGFANGSYLSLLFKRMHGCSPSEYRQSFQPQDKINEVKIKRSEFMTKQKQSS
jgi:AraC-like DNA-binding protein/mannose-6-phosphate isomerase-like protein (cupin superfamily)